MIIKKISILNFHSFARRSGGFALLFTVVIVSLILALALVIADISYRQTLLSNLAKDSQAAFYQADAGLECGMQYDVAQPDNFTRDGTPNTNPIDCGGQTLQYDQFDSKPNKYVFFTLPSTNPCFIITFDKTDPKKKVIKSDGYNTCTTSDRQVDRTLTVTY